MEEAGGKGEFMKCDVSNKDAVKALFAEIQEKYGKLDSELDFQIKEIKQKKLTNYQRHLLSKIEMEASEFDRKRNE